MENTDTIILPELSMFLSTLHYQMGDSRSALLPCLHAAQDFTGYITDEAILDISHSLEISTEEIETVIAPEPEPIIESTTINIIDETIEDKASEEILEELATEAVAAEEIKESFLLEPEPDPNDKKIIGEQFNKEPSLNDRLSSMNNNGTKVKSQPISSLKSSIGLNDKFLFTRELFGNVNAKFETTIEAIDNANSIVEAIEHLEQNYKWQRNETSLKFLELVKRRFDK